MAPRPNCGGPTLHGPSRVSRASDSAGTPPLAVDLDAQATLFTDDEEFDMLMLCLGECGMTPCCGHGAARSAAPPLRFSIDDLLQAPLSDGDAERIVRLLSDEEVRGILADAQLCSPPGSDDSDHAAAAKKRKRPHPPPPCSIGDDEPPSPEPRRPAKKRAPKKKVSKARLLRGWHKAIASRILARRFRAPDASRGRTALRCQCAELALADGGQSRECALHQDAGDGGEEWVQEEVRSRVPLAAGPGEVIVPRQAAGDRTAKVMRYARWRRGVWMPTRFYLQSAAERCSMLAGQPTYCDDGWMTDV